jgi:hypothetical protein
MPRVVEAPFFAQLEEKYYPSHMLLEIGMIKLRIKLPSHATGSSFPI